MPEDQNDSSSRIVFFDGFCHLCSGFVDFVIQNERLKKSLVFAPLQGKTAQTHLSPAETQSLDSIVLWEQGKIHRQSDAVLEIAKYLRQPWRFLGSLAKWVPASLRDFVYAWVARHRYQLFGRRQSCRLPRPEEKSQLWP